MKYGVTGYVFVCIGTEDDAQCGVVALGALEFIVHSAVHVHLSDILMCDFAGLEVDEDEALEDVVVENEVYVVVFFFGVDVLLTCYKGVSFSELHEEALEVGDDGILKVGLEIACIGCDPEKFGYDGILDELEFVLEGAGELSHFGLNEFFVLRREHTVVVL